MSKSVSRSDLEKNCFMDVKNRICLLETNFAFPKTWPWPLVYVDQGHVFIFFNFFVSMQIRFFTWDNYNEKKLKSIARFLFEEMGQAEQQGRIHGQYQLLTGGQGRRCAFSHFSTRAYRPTDWRKDGQSLLKSCVSAAKKKAGKWKKRERKKGNRRIHEQF